MPDVTTTLLAMYQQMIGGSNAREQSALEAEAARRVILAGITIGPGGAVTLGGNLTVLGTINLTTLSVTTLTVTGNASVTGTLACGPVTVTGAASVSGLVTASAGLSVTGATGLTGGLTVTGAATVGGTFTVNAVGGNGVVAANGVGPVVWGVQNTAPGGNASGTAVIGNDVNQSLGVLRACSSTFSLFAYNQANGFACVSTGVGGLNLAADNATGEVRFFSGGTTERMRIIASGEVGINANNAGNVQVAIGSDLSTHTGISIQNTNATNVGPMIWFLNSGGAVNGLIQQTSSTTVAYNTSSDARLKDDAGVATNLAALRGVVIHDFIWKADGVRDRGVFAQEAHRLYPRAVTAGTDDITETGALMQPWQTDYSKFVPDLIVGWQQHEAELADLRAHLLGREVAQHAVQIAHCGAQDATGDPAQILPVLGRPSRRRRQGRGAGGGASEAGGEQGQPLRDAIQRHADESSA